MIDKILERITLTKEDVHGMISSALREKSKTTVNTYEAPENATWVEIFSPEYINSLYPKHGRSIITAFDKFLPLKERKNPPPAKLKILNLFGTITDINKLTSVINSNSGLEFFQDLFGISSVSGAAGSDKEVSSGRGGLGKGEVLCTLLAKGGRSGGTSSVDVVADGFSAEVKSTDDNKINIPLAAARVPRLITQAELRKLFAMISEVSGTPLWKDFLENIQDILPANSKMLIDKNSGKYFKAEDTGNINGTELINLSKFFKGCNTYFFAKDVEDNEDSVYINIDGPESDILMKGRLTSPGTIQSIKPNSKVTFDILSRSEESVKGFQQFENNLKKLAFIKNPNLFIDTIKADTNTLLGIGFIVFDETSGIYKKSYYFNQAIGNSIISRFILNQAEVKLK